jgi:SAM-dependent methyltransferase
VLSSVLAATSTRAAPSRLLFIAAIALGSFLLFLIQPMFARMVLPQLGGAPAVWNTALLFYQTALLAGYAWAHFLSRAGGRTQAGAQLGLLGLAALALPFGVAALGPELTAASPALWLPLLFALSIGLPFVAVAAQAPLLQAWYARGGAAPYPLYAASNAGSLAALIAYPLWVERALPLDGQARLWAWMFAGLAALTALAALAALRMPDPAPAERGPAPSWATRLGWAARAAVPSGLLISTTAFLTTDVMAMPLLWVAPLALYLLSFIWAFARPGVWRMATLGASLALLSAGSYVFLAAGTAAAIGALAGLGVLFLVALALHADLARRAPAPGRATEFYLWIAAGGVVGGALPALLAPLAFDWTWEHPILLLAAAAMLTPLPFLPRLAALSTGRPWLPWLLAGIAAGAAWFAATRTIKGEVPPPEAIAAIALTAGLAVLAMGGRARFAFHLATVMVALGGGAALRQSIMEDSRARSFFGVYTVIDRGDVRELMHGTTLHGAQSLKPGLRYRPTTYYSPESGVGRVMDAAPDLFGIQARIGVVGLGTGTLACYAQPGQAWTFFEIDPLVVRIARADFTWLERCARDAAIELGDARLRLEAGPPARFDLLAVDAFSSDAIPLHLLTREALAAYGRALRPGGVMLIHISNRFLDLEPPLAGSVRDLGWKAMVHDHMLGLVPDGAPDSGSTWVLVARSQADLDRVMAAVNPFEWREPNAPAMARGWTDQRADLLGALKPDAFALD